MTISNRTLSEYQVYDIAGNIAFEETQDMEDYIYRHLSGNHTNIVINLKAVPYLNSSALGSFVRVLQTLKKQNMHLYIANVNEDNNNLFSITGVNKYFTFVQESDIH